MRRAHEAKTRITEQWRSGVADKRYRLTRQQFCNERLGEPGFVVIVQRQKRCFDPEMR